MLCSVDTCYQELLHAVQCCYMSHCVVEFCAAVLYVVMYSGMLCTVVTCYLELLHAVQCCYVLSRVITCCAVLLHVSLCC